MACQTSPPPLPRFIFTCFSFLILLDDFASSSSTLGFGRINSEKASSVRRIAEHRMLMTFRETPNGGNLTFECSPSGPCVPCAYSEKNDEKYRCSETGYRIPFKCIQSVDASKKVQKKKKKNGRSALENQEVNQQLRTASETLDSLQRRRLLDDSSTSENGSQAYITYRSCIPAVNEEKLSVLGFEGIMILLLLVSVSAIYYRRKKVNGVSAGFVRVPNSSRF